jgi:hypothetical protein
MNVCYVAGPYGAKTHRGTVENIRAAEKVALSLWRQGWAVICPHMNTALLDGAMYPDDPAADRETWLRGDLEIVERLIPGRDVLVTVPGYERSKGTEWEIAAAINRGVSVHHWPEDSKALQRLALVGRPIHLDTPDSPSD